ncbi:olfactory receptor 14A16-like [Calypte anna]|uniref:olfactory receptor 14A16-like n=1 Tax=Calypte anna TaxID=9244 RepID=UPI0011C37CFD|nr:olfactory receptor 14A16-like [Calypte anna]
MSNSSSIRQFLLLAFADRRELQPLHFWLFLGIYLAALLGNGLIITTIACDHHLHTPMYFFLLNLSLLDLGSISTTLPKAMANSFWDNTDISYRGCAAQTFFFLFFITAEFYLLTIMSYDRYVAICKPLHYGTLLGSRACVHMAAAAWGSGFLHALLHTANTFSLPLCQGNALDQFFCEIPQILKLSCSHSYLRELGLLVVSACLPFGCFIFIMVSYVEIFRAVLRIPSEQGRHKAFSTCLPHLAVVSLFISTAMFAHLKPPSISSPSLDLVVSFLYSVVPPAVNPLIYSMRNQELKSSLRKCYRVSQQKAQLVQEKVVYLGYEISRGQRSLGTARKEAICQMPRPETVRDLRAFLGVTGWCRLWIYQYGILAKLLYGLLKESKNILGNLCKRNGKDPFKCCSPPSLQSELRSDPPGSTTPESRGPLNIAKNIPEGARHYGLATFTADFG